MSVLRCEPLHYTIGRPVSASNVLTGHSYFGLRSLRIGGTAGHVGPNQAEGAKWWSESLINSHVRVSLRLIGTILWIGPGDNPPDNGPLWSRPEVPANVPYGGLSKAPKDRLY